MFPGARLLPLFCLSLILVVWAGLSSDSARFLSRELQGRFAEPGPTPTAVTGIISLGGGHDRIEEAVRVARLFPTAKLVVTGASAADEVYARTHITESTQLLIEPYARSTFENALFSRRLLNPLVGEKWLIVTSAIHMPRAIGTFREAGFAAVPWPVSAPPHTYAASERATWHEVFGLLAYWCLGRIDSLFPAPLV